MAGGRSWSSTTPAGRSPRPPPPIPWASWGHGTTASHYWPAWSPDQRRIATFRVPPGGGAQVWVVDVAGVSGAVVGSVDPGLPVIAQWSPSGDRLGILTKHSDSFVLRRARIEGDGDAEVVRGAVVSFCWLARDRIAAFVADRDGSARIAVVAPDGSQRDLAGSPGNFRTPVGLPSAVAYVAQMHQTVVVALSSLDGSRIRQLEMVEGLVALGSRPDGGALARAVAPGGVGQAYQRLDLIDLSSAAVTPLHHGPCAAFFWLPGGDGLVLARAAGDAIAWQRLDLDGRIRPLATLVPSPDTRAYLRFFEQYATSHPLVDPTGQCLVLCGANVGRTEPPSRIFVVPLDGTGPRELGEGVFATFPLPVESRDGS